MVTSPSGLCSILSMPLGPSDDLQMRATVLAARMLAFTASMPLMRVFFSPSCLRGRAKVDGPRRNVVRKHHLQHARTRMMMKGRPYSS